MELTGSRPVSWIGTHSPPAAVAAFLAQLLLFLWCQEWGLTMGQRDDHLETKDTAPLVRKVALPLLKDSQEPCQF